ncbi:MAG: hypothetical protein IE917_16790 [Betaproteobacteria bacterium]|nr:hypothetical protein [Paracoccaceae bacterium]MBD3813857.1 hypothetical protein [Betaproteobacteria bacterium]
MPPNRSTPPQGDTTADLTVVPAFILLFSIRLAKPFAGFHVQFPDITSLPTSQEQAYLAQFSDFEGRLLGETFLQARRIKRWPLGRIALTSDLENAPSYADVYLLAHKSGIALWEVWLPASDQPFNATRWIAWLDPDADHGLVAQLRRVLAPINQALTGKPTWSGTYFPVTVLRLPNHPLDSVIEQHGQDIVRLLFLNHAQWPLKRDLVREELDRDYCAREGGMTLLARRSGLDLHARESLAEEEEFADLPPRTALPFVITLELLLLERAVLQQLYERLSRGMPRSVDELLVLKQEMLDALEEYYGAITTATRFSDAVTVDGERLLGIVDLYDAVMDRLEAVSFEITTRYQKRMTTLQFWLTIVFGATEIGFIASSIATWYYKTELGAVLGWTVGAALVSGIGLVALLRGKLN